MAAAGVRRDAPLHPRQVPSRSLFPPLSAAGTPSCWLRAVARRNGRSATASRRFPSLRLVLESLLHPLSPAITGVPRVRSSLVSYSCPRRGAPCRSSAPCSRLRDQQAPSWSGLLPSIPLSDTRTPPAARRGSCRSAEAPLRMLVGVAKASTASEVWAVWLCSASLSYMCGCSKVIPNQT